MRRRVRFQTAIRASCQRCITSRTPSVHTLDALHEFVAGFHANRTFRGMGRDHRIPKVFLCLVMRSNVMISPLTVLAVRSRAHPVRAFDIVKKGLSESIYSAVSDSEDLFFFSLVQAVPHISGCANHLAVFTLQIQSSFHSDSGGRARHSGHRVRVSSSSRTNLYQQSVQNL
jgi:hypothetical protein